MIRRDIRFVILLATIAILTSSCGIDTFVYLYPVNQLLNSPSENDPVNNYFKFKTSDEDNNSSAYFKGYEIYYRIYSDKATRNSDVSAISAYNDANPTTALTTLVSSYRYTRMVYTGKTTDIPLIEGTTTNRVISIRLTDYFTYKASISDDGSNDGSGSLGIPMRTLNDGTKIVSFDYGNIHTSGDSDVSSNSSSSPDVWYVQAYVVAYGYDESYKPYYSSLFSLAHVVIKKS
jgi:hypothetical protein